MGKNRPWMIVAVLVLPPFLTMIGMPFGSHMETQGHEGAIGAIYHVWLTFFGRPVIYLGSDTVPGIILWLSALAFMLNLTAAFVIVYIVFMKGWGKGG